MNPMLDVLNYQDYQVYLKELLKYKQKSNPHYSLRAFARDIEIKPTQLSQVLNKKKGFSVLSACKVAQKLTLNQKETQYFCDLVRFSQEKSPQVKEMIKIRLREQIPSPQYQSMQNDLFKLISDWYHFAILELTFVKNFKSSTQWIANQLGITQLEAQNAVRLLLKLKLLKKENGKFVKTNKNITTQLNKKSEAIQAFNMQILEKAKLAVATQDVSKRDFSTMTMAINVSELDKAREIIKDCRRKLSQLLEAENQTELYCLSIQLFSLENQTETI